MLPTYPRSLSRAASRQLAQLGTTIRTRTMVTAIDADGVTVRGAEGGESSRIPARTVLWAAGVSVSTFGKAVAEATGAPVDRVGRIEVAADLTVPGYPDIWVVGDLAAAEWSPGKMVPGVAQGGIQGGQYAARSILAKRDGVTIPGFEFKRSWRAGHHRPAASGRRLPHGPRQRLRRLVHVAGDPHLLAHRLAESRTGDGPLGVVVPVARSR